MDNKDNSTLRGIYNKYIVTKIDGHTDPGADYFVLRLDKDPHARKSARIYAESIREDNRNLSLDLMMKIAKYEGTEVIKTLDTL